MPLSGDALDFGQVARLELLNHLGHLLRLRRKVNLILSGDW